MRLTKIVLTVAAASLVAGTLGHGALRRQVPPPSFVSRAALLGLSVDEVLERLGEPRQAGGSLSTLEFGYVDADGLLHPSAVLFAGGVVVKVDAAIGRLPGAPEPLPDDRPTLGMSVTRLPVLLGSAVSSRIGQVTFELEYAGGPVVTVCRDRVVSIESE